MRQNWNQFIPRTVAVISTAAFLIAPGNTPIAYADAEQTLSQEVCSYYDNWKAKYLTQDPYITDETQYYVFYGEQTYAEAGETIAVTVSEAHGYGMLITASMAAHDSEAKDIFDGMYRYYRAHLSEIGPNLMAWQQADNGSAIVNVSGADSATDGDLDIAYALLMADSIWGSNGAIDYFQAAVDMLDDIMTYEVNQTDWLLQLGDWVYGSAPGDPYYAATRSSDFMLAYMPVFAAATGDTRWITLYENTYAIIDQFLDTFGTGLLPDFICKDDTGKFVPAPANFLESEHDGHYYYNACRTPWRIAMDYLIHGDSRAKAYADTLNTWILQETGGDPWSILAGYTTGGAAVSDWNDLCFDAPFLIAAACGDNAQWHSDLRELCLHYGDDIYFGETITMLCLILDDGGWIIPSYPETDDKTPTLSDLIQLQRWLLGIPKTLPEAPAAWDMNGDGKLDGIDLCQMRRRLLF